METSTGADADEDARKRGRKRHRSLSRRAAGSAMQVDDDDDGGVRTRSRSRSRKLLKKSPQAEGLKSIAARKKVNKMMRQSQKRRNREQRKGPGDRTVLNMMPKHLYSGKRGIGSTDRR